jgi:hypothetical protein
MKVKQQTFHSKSCCCIPFPELITMNGAKESEFIFLFKKSSTLRELEEEKNWNSCLLELAILFKCIPLM